MKFGRSRILLLWNPPRVKRENETRDGVRTDPKHSVRLTPSFGPILLFLGELQATHAAPISSFSLPCVLWKFPMNAKYLDGRRS